MSKIDKYFRLAKIVAMKGDKLVQRRYRLGAVGIRTDGTIVTANNIACREVQVEAHAEARLVRKLNRGSEIYVVRILRDGTVAMARPCRKCQKAMRNRGINRVFYTISESEWGCLQL